MGYPRYDGTHDSDAEPCVVESSKGIHVAVSVDEVIEGDFGDKPRLDPFVDENAENSKRLERWE